MEKLNSKINSLNDSQVPASTVIATSSRERTTIDDDEAAIGDTVAVRYCSWGTLSDYGRSRRYRLNAEQSNDGKVQDYKKRKELVELSFTALGACGYSSNVWEVVDWSEIVLFVLQRSDF